MPRPRLRVWRGARNAPLSDANPPSAIAIAITTRCSFEAGQPTDTFAASQEYTFDQQAQQQGDFFVSRARSLFSEVATRARSLATDAPPARTHTPTRARHAAPPRHPPRLQAAEQASTPFGAEQQAAPFAAPAVDQFAALPAAPVSKKMELSAAAAAPMDGGSNPLVEFNKKFRCVARRRRPREGRSRPGALARTRACARTHGSRPPPARAPLPCRALCEDKDAKERDAKTARRAAGKAALKKALADRAAAVETRKASNREAEARKEKEAMDALEGEPWGRVVSLIDIHAHSKAAAAEGGEGGAPKKKAPADVAVPDVARHKNILISLKAAGGLPPATA
jgi:hypothetical protein